MSGFALLSFVAATKQIFVCSSEGPESQKLGKKKPPGGFFFFGVALKGQNPKTDMENLRDLQSALGKVPAAPGAMGIRVNFLK